MLNLSFFSVFLPGVVTKGLDLGDGTAEVAVFKPGSDRLVLAQILAMQIQLAGLLAEIGDLGELDRSAGRTGSRCLPLTMPGLG